MDLDLDRLILAEKEKMTKGREEDDDKKKKNEFLERGIFVVFRKAQISRLADQFGWKALITIFEKRTLTFAKNLK